MPLKRLSKRRHRALGAFVYFALLAKLVAFWAGTITVGQLRGSLTEATSATRAGVLWTAHLAFD